jgi:hypothetical protein
MLNFPIFTHFFAVADAVEQWSAKTSFFDYAGELKAKWVRPPTDCRRRFVFCNPQQGIMACIWGLAADAGWGLARLEACNLLFQLPTASVTHSIFSSGFAGFTTGPRPGPGLTGCPTSSPACNGSAHTRPSGSSRI